MASLRAWFTEAYMFASLASLLVLSPFLEVSLNPEQLCFWHFCIFLVCLCAMADMKSAFDKQHFCCWTESAAACSLCSSAC